MEPNTANKRRLNEARFKYYATKKHFEAAQKRRDAARAEYLVLLKADAEQER